MSKFRIAWMFPDTLYLHGDRGNVTALERFARIAGAEPITNKIDFDSHGFNPGEYQIIFFGPGEVSSFASIREHLEPYREGIKVFIESGRPMIVIGTTVGLFGRSIIRSSGEKINGLALTDSEFLENDKVYGDDIFFTASYGGRETDIIGNQIQMGNLILNSERAFGRLRYGYGNTGSSEDEGIIKNNSIFTNALAPVLVCNPRLTIEIVKIAASASGVEIDNAALDAYDDTLERKSLKIKEKFIMSKETHLKNCSRQSVF